MKILVANRGEIAVRVLRTIREMGHEGVAVYTDVDAASPHVWLAHEAIALGEPRAYLDIAKVLDAAKRAGCAMVHPGYGFLSENAQFATACRDAGITFIGPSPQAMAALGDKRAAREMAVKSGVPVVPGAEACDTVEEAQRAADAVGYPVLLKAAGGGGGKGMRRVNAASELPESYVTARREAKAAFNDDRVLVEKYVHPARHVEVQILADGTRAVTVGERECSLQRRYQKVIEESPSPGISEQTRTALLASAQEVCEAAGYAGAGTVEFLVGPDGQHYFLEVNTRLQVEHPVTELRSGLDLVQAQIEIALGAGVPTVPPLHGHAIEARLCAEDPYAGFLPQIGTAELVAWPNYPGVRVDTALESGAEISPHYDSMVAKVIAFGPTRQVATRRLTAALRETTLLGVQTNLPYVIELLGRPFFAEGNTFTTTLESESFARPDMPADIRELAEALAEGTGRTGAAPSVAPSPWESLRGFRMSP